MHAGSIMSVHPRRAKHCRCVTMSSGNELGSSSARTAHRNSNHPGASPNPQPWARTTRRRPTKGPRRARVQGQGNPSASRNTSTSPRRHLRRTPTKKATPSGSATTKACRSSCRPATSWRAAAPARIIAIINNGIDIKHVILDS